MSRKDEISEIENLSMLLRQVLSGAQIEPQSGQLVSPILKAFEASGKKLDVAEMFKRIIVGSGVEDWDKIILDADDIENQPTTKIKDLANEVNTFLSELGGEEPQQPQQPQQPIQREPRYQPRQPQQPQPISNI